MPDAAKPAVKVQYVDWSAVIAGAVLAAALSFVLLTAAATIGLSAVSLEERSYPRFVAWFAAFWAIAVPIGSLLAGAYVAGRMRPALTEQSSETGFRDGVHGALVWAASVVIGAFLAMSAVNTAGRVGATVAAGATEAAKVATPAVDTLLQLPAGAQGRQALSEEQRARIGRALASAVASGSLNPAARDDLNQTVAQATGIPPQDAEKRVNEAYQTVVRAVETSRKAAVAGGLLTVTALLFGLVAAWVAAQRGGHHRDINRPARLF